MSRVCGGAGPPMPYWLKSFTFARSGGFGIAVPGIVRFDAADIRLPTYPDILMYSKMGRRLAVENEIPRTTFNIQGNGQPVHVAVLDADSRMHGLPVLAFAASSELAA